MIARLYAVGDPVDERNVESVFAQLRHYKLASYDALMYIIGFYHIHYSEIKYLYDYNTIKVYLYNLIRSIKFFIFILF